MDFIPAQESSIFISLFRRYTYLLFKYRFENVWIRQYYYPTDEHKTVYYLNHHSWWDGLIPLLLNEYRFRQNARALMEDKQMERYRFFRKIGAFSIDRDNPRSAVRSLRYAIKSMKRHNASLFIYPEGKITPPGSSMNFEGGLAWLHSHLEDESVDFIPAGVHIHTVRSNKPELHLLIGKPAEIDMEMPDSDKTQKFESELEVVLEELTGDAGFTDSRFEKLV